MDVSTDVSTESEICQIASRRAVQQLDRWRLR